MFATVEAIAAHLISGFTPEEKAIGKTYSDDDLLSMHHSFGRYIRNEYGLWEADNPLTHAWHEARKDGGKEHIVDGVDYHPNHPDEISSKILLEIRRQLQMGN